jgi:hypothetical protein
MKTLRVTLLWPFVMFASLIVFTGVVFADAPADPATNPAGALQQFWDAIAAKKWGLAAVVGVMLFVAFARFISPRIHGRFGTFINSTRVSAVLALLSGGGAAMATQLLKGGAFSMQLVIYGFGFGVMAIGGYNAFFDILFPADKKPPTSGQAAKAATLLPLLFVAFAFSACAHTTPDQKAFGNAYASCMTARGLEVAPSVADEVWKDLNTGANKDIIVAQLEALGAKGVTDAVTCAVQAWLTGSTTKAARNPAGIEAANTYLKVHG